MHQVSYMTRQSSPITHTKNSIYILLSFGVKLTNVGPPSPLGNGSNLTSLDTLPLGSRLQTPERQRIKMCPIHIEASTWIMDTFLLYLDFLKTNYFVVQVMTHRDIVSIIYMVLYVFFVSNWHLYNWLLLGLAFLFMLPPCHFLLYKFQYNCYFNGRKLTGRVILILRLNLEFRCLTDSGRGVLSNIKHLTVQCWPNLLWGWFHKTTCYSSITFIY